MSNDLRRFINLVERANSLITDTPSFKTWFSGSKIVDADGNPLVVYHGTNREFDKFERRAESHDAGIYFTPDSKYASGYANYFVSDKIHQGANVRPCFLSIRNPLYVLTKPTDIELKIGKRGAMTEAVIAHFEAQGYDGIVVGVTDYEVEIGARSAADAGEICAFHPQQVRSAVMQENAGRRNHPSP